MRGGSAPDKISTSDTPAGVCVRVRVYVCVPAHQFSILKKVKVANKLLKAFLLSFPPPRVPLSVTCLIGDMSY